MCLARARSLGSSIEVWGLGVGCLALWDVASAVLFQLLDLVRHDLELALHFGNLVLGWLESADGGLIWELKSTLSPEPDRPCTQKGLKQDSQSGSKALQGAGFCSSPACTSLVQLGLAVLVTYGVPKHERR